MMRRWPKSVSPQRLYQPQLQKRLSHPWYQLLRQLAIRKIFHIAHQILSVSMMNYHFHVQKKNLLTTQLATTAHVNATRGKAREKEKEREDITMMEKARAREKEREKERAKERAKGKGKGKEARDRKVGATRTTTIMLNLTIPQCMTPAWFSLFGR